MKSKRIYYIGHIKDIDSLWKYWHIKDESIMRRYVWDNSDPEIVITSSYIYSNRDCFNEFERLYKNPYRRVFLAFVDEMFSPDMMLHDFAVVWTPFNLGERLYRIPFSIRGSKNRNENGHLSFYNDISEATARKLLSEKKFCNYIYSNQYAIPFRERIFHELSKYKAIDSLGAHLHNVDKPFDRWNENWYEDSIINKAGYKFSIAVENGIYSGYATEKILTSLYAHTIPIYYGDPDITYEINPKCFINARNYNCMADLINEIKRIDSNDDEWVRMVCESWYTESQIYNIERDMERFRQLLYQLAEEDNSKLIKRPIGTYTLNYYTRFFKHRFSNGLFERTGRAIKKIYSEKVKKETYMLWPLNQIISDIDK